MIYDVGGCRAEIFRPGMPLGTWLARQTIKPMALINASLYDFTTREPVGTIIEQGQLTHDAGTGYGFGVMPDGSAGFGTPWLGWTEYLTGHPALRRGGDYIVPKYRDPLGVFDAQLDRIGVGLMADRLCIVTGGKMTAEQFGRSVRIDEMINLDGGGSRFLYFDGKLIHDSSRTPYNAVAFYRDGETKEENKMKIYLSPSSQPANTYAAGGTNEQVQCRRIAAYAKTALDRCGFDTRIGAAEIDYTGRVNESNTWGADLHIPIHTNAGGGHGPIVFVYGLTAARTALAQPVYDALRAITPKSSGYGVRANSGLYEVAKSKGKCIYIEAAFHDDATEAAWIIDHAEALGEAICMGLCEGTGAAYIPPAVSKSDAAAEKWARSLGIIPDGDTAQTVTRSELAAALYAYHAALGAEDDKTTSGPLD